MARKKAEPKPMEEIEMNEQVNEPEQPAAGDMEEQTALEEAREPYPQETADSDDGTEQRDTEDLDFAAEESPFPESGEEPQAEPAEQTLDDDLLSEPGQPPEEGAYSETENEMHDLESEEDYGALLSETNALGLNNGADTEEPLTLPEDSDIPDTAAPDETESGELMENERRSPDSIGGRTARAAPVRERPRRETAAQAQRDNRILTIDAHDDILTEAERQEIVWHEIRNSHISQQILTGSLDSMERTPSGITVAVAIYKRFRIVIPLKEMLVLPSRWPSREARAEAMAQLPRLVNMRMGCEIDFIVRGIDSKKRSIVASRRAAMLRKRQAFYMERGDAGEPMIYPGRIVQARVVAVADKVIRVEVFGVECAIRASGISWEWIGNARDLYSVGDRVLVRVLSVERPNVENISIKADIRSISKNTNYDNLSKCKPQDKYVGRVTDTIGGVVFIRLNNGVNAIAHTCKDPRRPGRKDDVSFIVTKLDEEQGVAIGIITKIIRQNL